VKQKNSDQLFTNLFDLLSFDLRATFIFQRQLDSYSFDGETGRQRKAPVSF
jgi:hypothetical protein